MPSDTSHTDNLVSPPRAWMLTQGDPLSHWIAAGTPCSRKSRCRTYFTAPPVVLPTSLAAST